MATGFQTNKSIMNWCNY